MTEPEKAWVAGIVDGEGCITLMKSVKQRNYAPRLKVNNTDPRMLVRLKQITGVGGIYPLKIRGSRKKLAWDWTVSCNEALKVVEEIRPYLVVKGEQADMLLAYRSVKRRNGSRDMVVNNKLYEQQEWLHSRLKELKHELPSLECAQGQLPQSAEVR